MSDAMTETTTDAAGDSGDIKRLVGDEPGWAVLEKAGRFPGVVALLLCLAIAGGGVFFALIDGVLDDIKDFAIIAVSPIVVLIGVIFFIDSFLALKTARGIARAVDADIDFKEGKNPSTFKVSCAGRDWSIKEESFYKLKGGEELFIEHSALMRAPTLILVRKGTATPAADPAR